MLASQKRVLLIFFLFFAAVWGLYACFRHPLIIAFSGGRDHLTNSLAYLERVWDERFLRLSLTVSFFGFLAALFWADAEGARSFIHRSYKAIVLVLFCLFLLDVVNRFPFPDSLRSPIVQDDYAFHYAETLESTRYIVSSHRFWGYDPFHFAGYPGCLFFSQDNHWALALNLLLRPVLNSAFVFNLSIFLSLALLPLLMFFAARHLGLGSSNSLFVFFLSILFVAAYPPITEFYRYGMYAFVLGSFLSFFTLGLWTKYLRQKKSLTLVGLIGSGSLAFFVHPFAAVIMAVLFLTFLAAPSVPVRLKDFGTLSLSALLMLLLNAPWLLPALRFRNLYSGIAMRFNFQSEVQLPLTILRHNVFFDLAVLAVLLVFYRSLKRRGRRLELSVFLALLVFFVIAFFGSQIGLSLIEPGRFHVPLGLAWILAVSAFVETDLIKRRPLALAILLMISTSLAFSTGEKFTCRYPKEGRRILKFIKARCSSGSRIHVQDSWNHPYFSSHLTGLIPLLTSRPILAGPFNFMPVKFMSTQFIDEMLFMKPLKDISDAELDAYLELYNVEYFLVFSPEAKLFFGSKNRFRKVFNEPPFAIYRYLDSDENYAYHSQADVAADYDRIVVKNATSPRTILKFHYLSSLRVEPETVALRPIKLLDDPVPFIQVDNGACSNFIIYNK
jgi:hypothetical protein